MGIEKGRERERDKERDRERERHSHIFFSNRFKLLLTFQIVRAFPPVVFSNSFFVKLSACCAKSAIAIDTSVRRVTCAYQHFRSFIRGSGC